MNKSYFKMIQVTEAIAGNNCPVASQEPHINAANKASVIQNFLYGPTILMADNKEYFEMLAQAMNAAPEEVQMARCGNCAYNNNSPEIQQCIAIGMGGQEAFDPMETIEKAGMGYCQQFHFLCEAAKGCSAWVAAINEDPEEGEQK